MERELVAAAQEGDEVAFARLVASEAPRVYRAVLAIVRSPEDAQEVIQDASVRAWRHLRGLRDEDRWSAWYRRIAIRAAIDMAGRRKGRLVEIPLGGEVEPASADPTGGLVERIAVMSALARLSPEDRAILGLRYGADLEVPDVATVLGIPLGTAKSRLHRAVAKMAIEMEARDGRR